MISASIRFLTCSLLVFLTNQFCFSAQHAKSCIHLLKFKLITLMQIWWMQKKHVEGFDASRRFWTVCQRTTVHFSCTGWMLDTKNILSNKHCHATGKYPLLGTFWIVMTSLYLNFSQLKILNFLNFRWPPLLGTFPKFQHFLILKASLTLYIYRVIQNTGYPQNVFILVILKNLC